MTGSPQNGGKPATVGDISQVENNLKEWMLENLVARSFCEERHRYLDPRQIWKAAATSSVITAIIVALAVAGITHLAG